MGWLQPKPSSTSEVAYRSSPNGHDNSKQNTSSTPTEYSGSNVEPDLNNSAQHLERIDSHTGFTASTTLETKQDEEQHPLHPFQPSHLQDANLPFIPSTTVLKAQQDFRRVWIVVDDVVFDATDFFHEHPGGNTVIESFAGQDCSWQFWRFHNRKHMRDFGMGLRIGRTEGVGNRFSERPRFVGLRKLDVWD
jgi:cytochrome b involved in lipid metabolism